MNDPAVAEKTRLRLSTFDIIVLLITLAFGVDATVSRIQIDESAHRTED